MKFPFKSETLLVGLAMFSMFFGAGNIIFPLALGQMARDQFLISSLGLIITAVLIPFAGIFAMILFEGDYRSFFNRIGEKPGWLISFCVIALLGPLGSTPRCIALTFTAFKNLFPNLSYLPFCSGACLFIFLLAFKKNRILKILGSILTPLLLLSLSMIVFLGIYFTDYPLAQESTVSSPFLLGLMEGYNTMDLLAAFFFSSTMISLLKQKSKKDPLGLALKGGVIGAVLLALVYFGFCYLASLHSDILVSSKDELLFAIVQKVLGPSGALLVSFVIALACLTTAIALISVFTDFVKKELLKDQLSYEWTLFLSLALTFFISTFEFNGISSFLTPLLQIAYPGLIVLTLLNIYHKTTGYQPVKRMVFPAFFLSAMMSCV